MTKQKLSPNQKDPTSQTPKVPKDLIISVKSKFSKLLKNKKILISALSILLLLTSTGFILAKNAFFPKEQKLKQQLEQKQEAEDKQENQEIEDTPTPSPSSAPAKDTTLPSLIIQGGPADGSVFAYDNFCFPVYITDNVSKYPNLWIRTKLNSTSWSDWSDNISPCWSDIANDSYSFSVQAKDEAGNLSNTTTRNFTVNVPEDITVNVSGQIYEDKNCNAQRDADEANIAASAEVNISKMPSFFVIGTVNSGGSGSFSYSTTIKEDESITLNPGVVSPSGYKSHPTWSAPSFTLSAENPNASTEYPQVPNTSVGQCQF